MFDEGVEAGEEPAVAVGFVDPSPLFGVDDESFGVDSLGGEHAEVGGLGAEVRAVLTDVRVDAGALDGCS